ncbi:hypothetical protein NSPZN2_40493 [Nitrospira defluvii]|uniref:Uncharacterized protein n=1 Tax=Nitrospira defluvii TaxID=330214 RepID=A0ABN7M3Q7_9BACT|nr:hypothetical protein NSPZN2_40493 [Nitrospira defluvii]
MASNQAGLRILWQSYDSFLVTRPREPSPINAIKPAPNNHTAAGKGTREVNAPCTLFPTPLNTKRH